MMSARKKLFYIIILFTAILGSGCGKNNLQEKTETTEASFYKGGKVNATETQIAGNTEEVFLEENIKVPNQDARWKEAYINYINENTPEVGSIEASEFDGYVMADIDGNSVPELISFFYERLITIISCSNGTLHTTEMEGYILKYDASSGRILAAGSGKMDYDYFNLYEMNDGIVQKIASGYCGADKNYSMDNYDNIIFDTWVLNDEEVTKEEYEAVYNDIISDSEQYQDIIVYGGTYYGKEEIISMIEQY